MALIKNANADTLARDAVVLDLGNISQEAQRLRAQAEAEAQRILDEASAERDTLTRDAHEIGYTEGKAQGIADGLEQGRAQGRDEAMAAQQDRLDTLASALQAALDAHASSRASLADRAREDVLRLALTLAQRVTKRAIELDPEAVLAQLEAALALVLNPTRLRIAIHPDDAQTAREALPGLLARFSKDTDAELLEDDTLPRGSAIIRTDQGEVDANIDEQLDRIVSLVRPSSVDSATPPESP
ncbi:MAG: FliH/SctL family protein [Phycisphaerales bacterium JB043]